MVGITPALRQARVAGLTAAPPPGANPLSRLAAKVRLPAALKATAPPPDAALLPFYADALQAESLPPDTRARVCRALAYHGANTRTYVPEWIGYYAEAVCAFSDDSRCVLFTLSLLHSGAINAGGDAAFARGVYAAALFFPEWESLPERAALGVPAYPELRRTVAAQVIADGDPLTPDDDALLETVIAELGTRSDAGDHADECLELARYLGFARDAAPALRQTGRRAPSDALSGGDDVHDDPERILRGGSGDPGDDYRVAGRYVREGRVLDAAACALFARCVRHSEADSDTEGAAYWTVKLAHALIAVDRVDDDTHDLLHRAATTAPDNPLLELAAVYAAARNGDPGVGSSPEAAHRLERVVLDNGGIYKPLATGKNWDWNLLQRALALSWGHRGRTDGAARSLYKQVAAAHPDDRLLAVLQARALAQAKVYDDAALIAYERAVEIGKGSDAVRRALAIAYAQNNAANDPKRRDAATKLWEQMYRAGGMADNLEIIAALAGVYAETGGDSDVAVILWEKAARADPQNGVVRLRLAREMRGRGDAGGALALYKEAAKLLPDDFAAQYETGTVLQAGGDDAAAVRFLKRAAALPAGVRHADAQYALAAALTATEKPDEAKPILERVIETIDAAHQPSLLALASLHLRYEETGAKRAEVLLEKALAVDPSDVEAYRRLALLHEEQGRFADAETALEQYLAHAPPDAATTRKLAALYLKRGDFVKAESALRQTVALGGGDKKLFTQLGDVIQQAQKQRDAQALAAPSPKAVASNVVPERDTVLEERPRRQSIATQNTTVIAPAPSGDVQNPDSPTAQNLTRSLGAAAIKTALRNRAARLAQSLAQELPDDPAKTP